MRPTRPGHPHVNADTIARRESGRRPLASVPVGQMRVIRFSLMQSHTSPALLRPSERDQEAVVPLATVL